MNNMKTTKKQTVGRWLVWLVLALLMLQLVTAIGIRPAKTTVLSEEVSSYQGTFWVVNNDQMEFTAKVLVEGEMAQYISLSPEELSFRSDTDALPVNFVLNLPSSVPPGSSTANIVVEQEALSSQDNSISSKIILKHKILIQGPYPDKYVSTKLNFHEADNTIEFVSEVENLGKLDVDKILTRFYVNDKQQNQQSIQTEETSLKTSENKLLKASLGKELFEQGEFEVSAVTEYDGQQVELAKKLILGEPQVKVTYFNQFLLANKINEYTIDLLNEWNQKIKNVFVDVEVKKDNIKIDEFRTKSVDLEAELSKRISDYYDARDVNTGKYTFDLVINFWNLVRMDQALYTFETEFLEEESIDNVPALAGRAAGDAEEQSSLPWLWIVGGGMVLIMILAILFIVWRYLHREEYEGGDGGL